jgi:hypothetical protein
VGTPPCTEFRIPLPSARSRVPSASGTEMIRVVLALIELAKNLNAFVESISFLKVVVESLSETLEPYALNVPVLVELELSVMVPVMVPLDSVLFVKVCVAVSVTMVSLTSGKMNVLVVPVVILAAEN